MILSPPPSAIHDQSHLLLFPNSSYCFALSILLIGAVACQVGEAKRVLKIMNMLESMLSSEADSQSGGAAGVRTKIQVCPANLVLVPAYPPNSFAVSWA